MLHAVKGSDFFCIVSGKIAPETIAEVKCSEYAVTRKVYEANSASQKNNPPTPSLVSKRSSISLLSSPVAPPAPPAVDDHDTSFDDIYGKGDDSGNF